MIARDGGKEIVAGNDRVIAARLADARFFFDQDRRTRLQDLLPKLDHVTFHAKLGTQGERVRRIEALAATIAAIIGADSDAAQQAARLAKADLVTGMVGEFPELQGMMGHYYAIEEASTTRWRTACATITSRKVRPTSCRRRGSPWRWRSRTSSIR